MQFAQVVTVAAAVLSAPLALAASAPMQSDEFLSRVRCAAYESLPQFAGESAGAGAERMRLNAEARRQPAAVASEARSAVAAIAHHADVIEIAALRQERDVACAGASAMIADSAATKTEG